MNGIEHFLCSTSLWRYLTQRQVLPWVLSGVRLGDHILEIGAGYGPATSQLRKIVPRVTSLEYDANSARYLKAQHDGGPGGALRGDAAQLPFASQTFSSAIAILVLHHLRSRGIFLAFEINDSWVHRVGHFRSTFNPVSAGSAFARLTRAGFSRISVDFRRGAFRIGALREKDSPTNT